MRQKRYKESEKRSIVQRYLSGESIDIIMSSTGVARSTVHAWTRRYQSELSSTLMVEEKSTSFQQLHPVESTSEIANISVEVVTPNGYQFKFEGLPTSALLEVLQSFKDV